MPDPTRNEPNRPPERPADTRRLSVAPSPERIALDLIRSVIGHADGHEVEAVEKIRAVLANHGEGVR
jgi:hypothetical protein